MTALSAIDPTTMTPRAHGLVVVVIETPSGSGNKLKFDPDLGVYRLDRTLPSGMTFPFDFGFIPRTMAEDGDPLDAIVLLDAPAFPGCVVETRLIGILEAEQQEGGKGPWIRNDRLLAVAGGPKGHSTVRAMSDLDADQMGTIATFFATYHALDGDRFRIIGHGGSRAAQTAIRRARAAFDERRVDGHERR